MSCTVRSIQVQVREVYGELKVYPVCETAKLFAEMLGTKTLARRGWTTVCRCS